MSPVDLRALVREIPDFPQQGILFKDITPLMADPDATNVLASVPKFSESNAVITADPANPPIENSA